ncbi:MAG: hypothetical protein ABFS38_20545 [Bacteroidota bacterium]
MKKLISQIALIMLVVHANAQLKTYLTLEAGPQWSLVKVADQGGYFQSANVKSSMAGITLGQEIMPNLSLVTGIYYQPYMDGINMIDDRPQQSRWATYTAFLIPLRAEYRVQFSEFPVSLTPRLGYIYGMISQPETGYQASGILSAPDGTALGYDLTHDYESVSLHMLETGIGLNLRFFGIWQASLNLSYLTGFTEPASTSVAYSGMGVPVSSATYTTRGNTLYSSLAFSVPVSNIWQNKDYRIRSRIENSAYAGKPTEKKGEVYAGGEVGSLWRQFNITNPAIGARPMTDRGIFRYANLHAGGYVGYMFSEELGIDLGVNYQRSSTFYALSYDHEVDFVMNAPAPLFLEVPVRVRYFYDLYKKRLYYVVYGGASLLTHFNLGNYAQGGGSFTYNSPVSGAPLPASTSYNASRPSRFRPAMRIGTGIEYLLPTNFPLIATLYLNYMHGFISADEIRISNTLPETPSESVVSYNGSGWSLDVGIKIPFRFDGGGVCGKRPER